MILAVCLAYQKRWIVSSEIEGLMFAPFLLMRTEIRERARWEILRKTCWCRLRFTAADRRAAGQRGCSAAVC